MSLTRSGNAHWTAKCRDTARWILKSFGCGEWLLLLWLLLIILSINQLVVWKETRKYSHLRAGIRILTVFIYFLLLCIIVFYIETCTHSYT